MHVTTKQFGSMLHSSGVIVHAKTVRTWFRAWRDRGVKHIVEIPSTVGGGRAGTVLAMTLDGVRAYCRGELPSPH